jgi:phospholipase C
MVGAALAAVAMGVPAAASPTAIRADEQATATPIQHLVVIFQENVSFDHYFGTYPVAANPAGEPGFHAAAGTPTVNGLGDPTGALLSNNPNLSNPQRLDRSQALTCDQGHDYMPEQLAFDKGAMDQFVQHTGNQKTVAQCTGKATGVSPNYAVMDYYDGNTVTGLWNYARRFAMSDNSFSDVFGPSTPGAFNVIAGNTFGATCGPSSAVYKGTSCPVGVGTAGPAVAQGPGTTYSDADPLYDGCSAGSTLAMGGKNIGDLLNARGITWGWFQGGFRPSSRTSAGAPVCGAAHTNIGGSTVTDYSAHHEPFQYYPQTANPQHLAPSSVGKIGHGDQANHQYDLTDFWAAADSGNLPQVSYLKASKYQDGHAGYSDPLDEQHFLVDTINHLQRLPDWRSTAVVINYDDSDGWYDHVMGPIVTQSQTVLDALTGTGQCGSNPAAVPSGQQARCGVGPRQPLLVISPWARENFVDHSFSTQSSVVRFIEDNWGLGRIGGGASDRMAGKLDTMFDFSHPNGERAFLNPLTGQPAGDN